MAEKKDEKRVTRVLPRKNDRVTEKLPESGYQPDRDPGRSHQPDSKPASWSRTVLQIDEIVDGRYLVLTEPIGEETGEAQVFKCTDLQTQQEVALKLYRTDVFPKKEVMENLVNLDHPNLVGLRGYGQWTGRFYEIQEFCSGGSISEKMPLAESKVVNYLRQIVTGLKFCHDQGIVHRDVKPNNILFRDIEGRDLVLGDFGISSFLPEGEHEKKTRTFMVFTIDYCSPEQLRLREVGAPTDYYSLGITLCCLLEGRSPFYGLSDDEIVDCHLQGKVPSPAGASDDFIRLIKGLLRGSPLKRWGYSQVTAWLRGDPILDNEGKPDKGEVYYQEGISYPEFPEAKNPLELSRHLDEFDAVGDLFKGKISLWVKLFDQALAEKIIDIEEEYAHNQDLGVFKLRFILDPDLPLIAGGREISDLRDMVAALRSKDERCLADLSDFFWSGHVEAWMDAKRNNGGDSKLVARIREFRVKHTGRRKMGTLHLLFMLTPQAPLRLGPGQVVKSPEEMADVLIRHPEVSDVVKAYLFNGQLAAWLEICFPERLEDAAFLSDCEERYSKDRPLGINALIWYFRPNTPFVFGRKQVTSPSELAACIDENKESWNRGVDLIHSGILRAWLTSTGMLEDASAFDALIANESFSNDVKLEMLLHLLDPDLPKPVVACSTRSIDMGDIPAGGTGIHEFLIKNEGRGQLTGKLRIEGVGNEVSLSPAVLDGAETRVLIKARPPSWLSPGINREGRIIVESNGGGLELPVKYMVDFPEWTPPPEPAPPGPVSRFISWLASLFE